MPEKLPSQPEPTGGYETRDVNARGVVWFAAGLSVTIVIIFFAIRGLMTAFSAPQQAAVTSDNNNPQVLHPGPQLQADPPRDLVRFREQESNALNTTSWINHTAGIVRIPIEQAMELIAQRGLPASQFSSGKTPLQMRQERTNSEPSRP